MQVDGWFGAAPSSSASVGIRFSANWAATNLPSTVMNSPAGTEAARSATASSIRDGEDRLDGRQKVSRDVRVPKIVAVRVDQTRRNGAPAQIDNLRRWINSSDVITDSHNSTLPDPDRRDNRVILVQGQNSTVYQDKLRSSLYWSAQRDNGQGGKLARPGLNHGGGNQAVRRHLQGAFKIGDVQRRRPGKLGEKGGQMGPYQATLPQRWPTRLPPDRTAAGPG